MPGPLFHVGAVAMCPHGGQVTTVSANTAGAGKRDAGGAGHRPVHRWPGCVFNVVGHAAALRHGPVDRADGRDLVNGQPAVTALSAGLCIAANGVPNGAGDRASSTQPRAVAS